MTSSMLDDMCVHVVIGVEPRAADRRILCYHPTVPSRIDKRKISLSLSFSS